MCTSPATISSFCIHIFIFQKVKVRFFSFWKFIFFHKLIIKHVKEIACARNILKKLGYCLWSASVKNFNRAKISKLLDSKPEILFSFNWNYVAVLMPHRTFHKNLAILINFNTCLDRSKSIEILMETKRKKFVK